LPNPGARELARVESGGAALVLVTQAGCISWNARRTARLFAAEFAAAHANMCSGRSDLRRGDHHQRKDPDAYASKGARPAVPRAADTLRSLPRRTGGTRDRKPARSSSVLKPIGETASYQGSFVAGYRRRLPHGNSCGDEARAAARVYGIELGAGWTWVKPHKRGLPDGFVLRYAWRMSPQLRASAGEVSA
jgi:hypothetical protein